MLTGKPQKSQETNVGISDKYGGVKSGSISKIMKTQVEIEEGSPL